MRRHGDEARAAAKEQVYAWRVASNADLPKAGQLLRFFTDGSVSENEPFCEVRRKAFEVLDPATGSCAKASKPAMFSAGTAFVSAASRMTWWMIASGKTRKD